MTTCKMLRRFKLGWFMAAVEPEPRVPSGIRSKETENRGDRWTRPMTEPVEKAVSRVPVTSGKYDTGSDFAVQLWSSWMTWKMKKLRILALAGGTVAAAEIGENDGEEAAGGSATTTQAICP
jgi:hypothetical protein